MRWLEEGKVIRTPRFGSSEAHVLKGKSIIVTPRIGGRELKEVVYTHFDGWFKAEMAHWKTDEINIYE